MDFDGFSLDDDMFEGMMEHGSAMAALSMFHMQDELKDEAERVNPDTYGCDSIFVRNFVTPDMQADFPVIANAFYRNVPESLTFENYDYYIDTRIKNSYAINAFSVFTLSQILSSARRGNEYSSQLLKYLYKTYYKKEYKTLKRFSRIKPAEIMSINETIRYAEPEFAGTARILTMCPFLNIEPDIECSFLYLILDRYNNAFEQRTLVLEQEFMEKEEYYECGSVMADLFDTNDIEELRKNAKDYKNYSRFRKAALKHLGYPVDFTDYLEDDIQVEYCYVHTIHILKKMFPNKEITKEELQMYASIYYDMYVLTDAMDEIDEYFQKLYGEIDDYVLENSFFKPDDFEEATGLNKKSDRKTKAAKQQEPPVRAVASPADAKYDQEQLLKEIADLRNKLHNKEYDVQHLSELYKDAKKQAADAEAEKHIFESEHEELVALREHVYNSTEEDIVIPKESRQQMIDSISKKRVLIIGGHSNWIQKMKEVFPDWGYINFKNTTTVDDSILNNVEYVYFFTDFIKHHVYNRFISQVRSKKIPFGYIGSTNIDKCIRQLAEEMK